MYTQFVLKSRELSVQMCGCEDILSVSIFNKIGAVATNIATK